MNVSQNDLVFDFAKYSVATKFEDLPSDAIEAAKKSFIDLIGVILAASGIEPVSNLIIDFVRESGGRAEATVLGVAGQFPAASAAFANGAMAHCLDFDDLTPWGAHATSSILPAILAVGERKGRMSGREVIAAIAVGQDIFARMRRNVDWRKDWNISTIFGVYAATAAAGRILGLSEAQMASALGIASMQSAGTMDVVYGLGGDLRCIYAAFSAKAAVVSALLAEKGVVGTQSAFTGEYGFFNTFFRNGFNREQMVAGLGVDFQGNTTLYKPWPAVGPSHSHIYATIQLVSEHDLMPGDIEEIRVHIGDYHEIMCSPLETRQAPSTLVDAKFSLPFLVAVAAVNRNVAIANFIEGGLQDPEVLGVARKVVPVKNPDFDWKFELPGGKVEILTRDGRKLERIGSNVPGSSEAPLGWEEIERKFAACAGVGATPLSVSQITWVQEKSRNLEAVQDVGEILKALRPTA